MLEAFYNNVRGVYTKDFPDQPPFVINYTDPSLAFGNNNLTNAPKSTKAKTLKFNSTIQVVLPPWHGEPSYSHSWLQFLCFGSRLWEL